MYRICKETSCINDWNLKVFTFFIRQLYQLRWNISRIMCCILFLFNFMSKAIRCRYISFSFSSPRLLHRTNTENILRFHLKHSRFCISSLYPWALISKNAFKNLHEKKNMIWNNIFFFWVEKIPRWRKIRYCLRSWLTCLPQFGRWWW